MVIVGLEVFSDSIQIFPNVNVSDTDHVAFQIQIRSIEIM